MSTTLSPTTFSPLSQDRLRLNNSQFHDWSDDKCREILLALKPALVPGYSKVLIQESMIPLQGATSLSTAADLAMMCSLAGRERTEKGFKELAESAGMKITGIFTPLPGEESIIEVSLG